MSDFLTLSRDFNTLFIFCKKLLQLHATRYAHFVDSSPLGEDCTYAKITKREFESERELTRERLREIRDKASHLLEVLDNE